MPFKRTKSDAEIHRIPGSRDQIHRDYGLWICSYGSSVAPKESFFCNVRAFEFYCLSHMHRGEGALWMETSGQQAIEPGDCVVMTPQTAHQFGGLSKPYEEDTVCFTGEIADRLYHSGVIRPGVYRIGIARRVFQIMRLAQDPAPFAQVEANIALQRLLFDIYTEARINAPGRKDQRIHNLVAAFRQDLAQWWTLDAMAEFCNLGHDQFRRVFRREIGERPKLYLDRLRFAKVAELLSSTSLSLSDLATRFGYSDPFHFSRRFKEIYGIAPKHYRQQVRFIDRR